MPRWLWMNCFIVGMISPVANLIANYQKVVTRNNGDVNQFLLLFPPMIVHGVFLCGIVDQYFQSGGDVVLFGALLDAAAARGR